MPAGKADYHKSKVAAGGMYEKWFEVFLDLIIKVNYYGNLVKGGSFQFLQAYFSQLYTLYTNLLIVTNDNGNNKIRDDTKALVGECENLLFQLNWYPSSKRSDASMRNSINQQLASKLNKLNCDLTVAFQKTGLGIKMNVIASEGMKKSQRFTT